jgi:hypothetical protein
MTERTNQSMKVTSILSTSQLNDLDRRVTDIADAWYRTRKEPDTSLLDTIAYLTEEEDDVRAPAVVSVACESFPDLDRAYGQEALMHCVDQLFTSEFVELSEIYTVLFNDLNIRHFQGALPPYHVRVIGKAPKGSSEHCFEPTDIDIRGRQLRIHFNGVPEEMVDWLMTLMLRVQKM